MRNLIIGSLACALVAVGGCGGSDGSSSGVERSKQIEELSAGERQQLCEWGTAEQGGAGAMYECDGFTVTIDTVEECVTGLSDLESCDLTVGDLEDCNGNRGDPCSTSLPPACAALFECLFPPGS